MRGSATATFKELCDEAGESIRAMEPRRLEAEVVSVRSAGSDIWTTVVDAGDCVDVLIPGGQLSGRVTQVKQGMVLHLYVQPKPQRQESGWFCVALHARLVRTVGPVARNRERLGRMLVAEGVIRRRQMDARQYSHNIRGIQSAKRITALVPTSGRAGWKDVSGQLSHLPQGQVVVVPVGGRGKTMAQGCADFLAAMRPDEADVVAIIRGGGNKAGLAEFNNADLARAIKASPVPVVTAIGHREDVSLADAAAHSAFATPGEAGRALSLVSNGPVARARKQREAEVAQLEEDLSAQRRQVEERGREVMRWRHCAEAAARDVRLWRTDAESAHRWIDLHLVEDAVDRTRRRADRLVALSAALCLALLLTVAVWGAAPRITLSIAAALVAVSVWVMWGPTRVAAAMDSPRPHRDGAAAQEWRDRVRQSRTPAQLLRALR